MVTLCVLVVENEKFNMKKVAGYFLSLNLLFNFAF